MFQIPLLDVNGNIIQIGDKVAFLAKGEQVEIGIVFKITLHYVWMKCPLFGNINKRKFKNVGKLNNF